MFRPTALNEINEINVLEYVWKADRLIVGSRHTADISQSHVVIRDALFIRLRCTAYFTRRQTVFWLYV